MNFSTSYYLYSSGVRIHCNDLIGVAWIWKILIITLINAKLTLEGGLQSGSIVRHLSLLCCGVFLILYLPLDTEAQHGFSLIPRHTHLAFQSASRQLPWVCDCMCARTWFSQQQHSRSDIQSQYLVASKKLEQCQITIVSEQTARCLNCGVFHLKTQIIPCTNSNSLARLSHSL